MRQYKISELKNLVRRGTAHDLTHATPAEVLEISRRCYKIGFSYGLYSLAGVLLQDIKTGKYYVITALNPNFSCIF